jgi:hypothetical protein
LGSRVKLVLWWAQGSHMKHLLSLILVLGCSSSTPSQYDRGTLTGPPPAQQRPGVGLPTYDPHVAPRPEPQPAQSRLLPQTPETQRQPGIWASGNEPSAAPSVKMFETEISLPAETAAAAGLIERLKECASDLQQAAWRSKDATAIQRMGEKQHLCLGTWLLAVCAKDNQATSGRWRDAKTKSMKPVLKSVVDNLFRSRDQRCAPPSREDSVRDIFNWTTAHWRESRGWGSRDGT